MRITPNLLRRYGVPMLAFIFGLSMSPYLMGVPDEASKTTFVSHHMREKDHLDLLIFVVSAPGNFDRREAIRTTWLSHQHNAIRGYFVIGTLGLTTDLLNALEKDVKRMKKENRLYWGYFDGRAPVLKQGKWAEKRYVLCDKYIPYALGGGYVIGWDLVSFIAQTAPMLIQYKNEDVSMGTWMASVNVNRIHDERFDTEWKTRGCLNNHLVKQNQSPEQIKQMWERLSVGEPLCSIEVVKRPSYMYDWEQPPSQCCKVVK